MTSLSRAAGRDADVQNGSLDSAPPVASGAADLRAHAVLEVRARALARPVADGRAADTIQVVLLRLAGESYAIESRFVFEAIRSAEIALIPGAQPPVFGLTAWRGDLLTLLDLRAALELPRVEEAPTGEILVIGEATPAFGILVDAAENIREISIAEIRRPADSSSPAIGFIQGITSDAVLVIDAANLIRTFP